MHVSFEYHILFHFIINKFRSYLTSPLFLGIITWDKILYWGGRGWRGAVLRVWHAFVDLRET